MVVWGFMFFVFSLRKLATSLRWWYGRLLFCRKSEAAVKMFTEALHINKG
jgi:hypothetical protein